jgi:exonuclease VII large subunit
MDPQQLLATLIQLSDEQQQRIAELLNRLEQQTRTLTTASQRATQAANALDRSGQKTVLHLQAAGSRERGNRLAQNTLTTISQRAEQAFKEAEPPYGEVSPISTHIWLTSQWNPLKT